MSLPPQLHLPVIVMSNALPLVGVLTMGWDIYTLLIFYWLETAIITFWTVMTVALNDGEAVFAHTGSGSRDSGPKPFIGLMLFLHAGAFLAVHLYLISSLYGGAWPGHLNSAQEFLGTFLIEQRLWPMLAFIFLHRGVMFLDERRHEDVTQSVYSLYARIVVMQLVIIIGSWGVLMLGSGLFGLILLVSMRAALDMYWPQILNALVRAVKSAPQT